MCGIAGFVTQDPNEGDARFLLSRMLAGLVHRGPDSDGSYACPSLGLYLGMRRLRIIDLEQGEQPIWNEDKTVCIVFNGEIYNYIELRADLEANGHIFTTRSDTEVLVHLYEEKGVQSFLADVRGMFALAIADFRVQELILARDPFGQKPLYYHKSDTFFAFSSELPSLLSHKDVPRQIDESAFLPYVAWNSLPAPHTHYQNVRKIGPGRVTVIDMKTLAHREFSHTPLLSNGELEHFHLEPAIDFLDRALAESLRMHLRSDVPVGILLSGGLDSRCVAYYARQASASSIHTFSIGFEHDPQELPEAARTAREIGTTHHEIVLNLSDAASLLGKVVAHLGEPLGDPAAFAVLAICQRAREFVKVLLGGEGADELFGGYEERYRGIQSTLQRSNRFRPYRLLLPRSQAFPRSRFGRLCHRAHMLAGTEIVQLRMEGLPGNLAAPFGLDEAQLEQLHSWSVVFAHELLPAATGSLNDAMLLDRRWQLPEGLLHKADRMSMAASLELRCPFLDPQVAALALATDPRLKLPDGKPGKHLLRQCLSRHLDEPPSRPKLGFPVQTEALLKGPLQEMVQDLVFGSGSNLAERVSSKQLGTLLTQFHASDPRAIHAVYACLIYSLWRKQPFAEPNN